MLTSVRGELWAIDEHRLQGFALNCLEANQKAALNITLEDFYTFRQPMSIDGNGIAHISVVGALLNKAPRIYEKLGLATLYPTIRQETSAAVDAGATGILYHVDSPGGTVAGCIETAKAIASAGVRTAAFCDGISCSAAYWLTSQAGAVFASPSSEVGNIGAILSWADCSAFWEKAGIEFKALTNEGADLKSTFHLEPDAAQIEFLQDRINAAGAAFHEGVITGRKKAGATLDNEVFRAGWYSGEKAIELGLINDYGYLSDAIEFLLD